MWEHTWILLVCFFSQTKLSKLQNNIENTIANIQSSAKQWGHILVTTDLQAALDH